MQPGHPTAGPLPREKVPVINVLAVLPGDTIAPDDPVLDYTECQAPVGGQTLGIDRKPIQDQIYHIEPVEQPSADRWRKLALRRGYSQRSADPRGPGQSRKTGRFRGSGPSQFWRRHPDSNRGCGFCKPVPYHLAMPPENSRGWGMPSQPGDLAFPLIATRRWGSRREPWADPREGEAGRQSWGEVRKDPRRAAAAAMPALAVGWGWSTG